MAGRFLKNKMKISFLQQCITCVVRLCTEPNALCMTTVSKMIFKIRKLPGSRKILKWSREQSCSVRG